MKTILAFFAIWAATSTAIAETLACEIWDAGDIPSDFSSAQFAEARSKGLKAQAMIEKPALAIGDLRGLLATAVRKSGLKEEDYRSARPRVSIFRKGASGRMTLIVDGRDAATVRLSSVYDTDIIIFHEFLIR